MDRDYWNTGKVVYPRKTKKNRGLLTPRRLIALASLASLAFIFFGIRAFLHIQYFQVADVNISGIDSAMAEEIRSAFNRELAGDRWYLVPRRNILFFSPKAGAAFIQSAFPEVNEVSIKKTFPNEVEVAASLRKVWAVLCYEERGRDPLKLSESKDCYFIDEEGILFDTAPSVSGRLILTVHTDRLPRPLGESAITADEVFKLKRIKERLKENAGINAIGFVLRENAPKDAWAKTADGYYIIFTKDDIPERLSSTIKAAIEGEVKGNTAGLLYIDARFGNKLFVKYR